MRRFLVAFTALFAGALAVEVLNYHPLTTIAKDPWAIAPQLAEPLLLLAALLVLARPAHASIRLFVAASGVSIVIGLMGVGFHWASHGLPVGFASPTSWLGEPPPLAPFEFSVAGLLGLWSVSWTRGGSLVPARANSAAAVCYGLGALAALTAIAVAAFLLLVAALIAVFAALLIGALGYVLEIPRYEAEPR